MYKIWIIVFYIYFSLNIVNADIFSLSSIESDQVENLVKLVDSKSTVFIEIENNILLPAAAMFHPNSLGKDFIENMTTLSYKKPIYEKAVRTWLLRRRVMLTEPGWPAFIEKLQQKGAKVFGVIKMNGLVYKTFKDPELWKFNELITYNIKFTHKLNEQDIVLLANIDNKLTELYQGILFTGLMAKSSALENLFRIPGVLQNKIFYIDSNRENIKSIESYMYKFNTKYYGVLYNGYLKVPNLSNSEIMEFQQKMLLEHDTWLEDPEATIMMKNTKPVT